MKNANRLIEFIKASPTAYHTVDTLRTLLLASGYTELSESQLQDFSDGGKHFVIKNGTSLIAFRGKSEQCGFMITASHSDNPSFKVKGSVAAAPYAKLAVERYGGMILYSWLDRPLSVAGRVVLSTDSGLAVKNVDLCRDVAVIPSVAIHMNRTVNEGYKFNPAVDMLPLVGLDTGRTVLDAVADVLDTDTGSILSHDLFLYNRQSGRTFGMNGELILAPRLDDLGCVFASATAFLEAEETDASVAVLAVFDNEEVGSDTKQGAASTFLADTLQKIAGSDATYARMLSASLMVSADNAHARHPNHPELSDQMNAPVLGGGTVIKYNANQKYATDAVSDAVFRTLAARAGSAIQSYYNRADLPGGSTLGSIANTKVSVLTVDVGLPQLAMHSAVETAAVSDVDNMIAIFKELYSTGILLADGGLSLVKNK